MSAIWLNVELARSGAQMKSPLRIAFVLAIVAVVGAFGIYANRETNDQRIDRVCKANYLTTSEQNECKYRELIQTLKPNETP
jgi:hypothetical protein